MLRQAQIDDPPLGTHVACDPKDVAIICASSGTTGKPVFMPLSGSDQANWAEILCRIYWGWGVRPGDRFAHLASFHMFTAGLPVYPAFLKLGVTTLPIGAQVAAERALDLMRELKPTAMVLTPSFAEHLAAKCHEHLGVAPRELGIKYVGLGAEPLLPQTRLKVNYEWGVEAFNMGGMGEMCTAMWTECERRDGLHFLANDYVHVEIINQESAQPVEMRAGASGELVYTALDRQAAPLVRFRTGDQVDVVATEPCACGRTSFRFLLKGRTDDMLKVHGVRVWASAVRDVVAEARPRTTGYAQLILKTKDITQPAPLVVEAEHAPSVPPEDLPGLKSELEADVLRRLLVRTNIRLVPEGSLERSSGKYRYIRYES
jgi:phenylacetate-CoA ligase